MSALVPFAQTVEAEPVRLGVPWYLPQVPARPLSTLEAEERELVDLIRENRRQHSRLENELGSLRNRLAAVREDITDHAQNVACGRFPEDAA